MIEFKGTSEQQWLETPAHRIKDIIKRLNKYKDEHKNEGICPLSKRK